MYLVTSTVMNKTFKFSLLQDAENCYTDLSNGMPDYLWTLTKE